MAESVGEHVAGEADLVLRKGDDWRELALCVETDPEIFFAKPEEKVTIRQAKAICAECPMRQICLDEALQSDERYGILGGMTPRERRALRKRMGLERVA